MLSGTAGSVVIRFLGSNCITDSRETAVGAKQNAILLFVFGWYFLYEIIRSGSVASILNWSDWRFDGGEPRKNDP